MTRATTTAMFGAYVGVPSPELNSSWWHASSGFGRVGVASGLDRGVWARSGPRLACDYTLGGPEQANSAR
jgi:hypothetical protein